MTEHNAPVGAVALRAENATLRWAINEAWWMARRYADGRRTYATRMYNDATRALLALGVEVRQADGTPWARDGDGRACDGLTDEEAALGRPPDYLSLPERDRYEARIAALAERVHRTELVVVAARDAVEWTRGRAGKNLLVALAVLDATPPDPEEADHGRA